MHYAIFATDWGPFGIIVSDERLVASYLLFSDDQMRRRIRREWPGAHEASQIMTPLQREVQAYFRGEPCTFDVPVDLSRLTSFQRRVLQACREIPYGSTVSYAGLAAKIGSPGAARAVGGAMASNPMPLVIPCHRVLRSDGGLGGFTSPRGVRLKERMLQLEKTNAPCEVIPVSGERQRRRLASAV